ncbi:MAG: hypothetical protein HQK55_07355 [Deltaproteobacteria bacterium]|nr:hypothetical protein [Deltaproteobacteria bacterium]
MKEHEAKARLLGVLTRHVGQEKALGMDELFESVFQRPVNHKINDTRELRRLITRLRLDGVPIASVSRPEGGGYYIARAKSEMEDFLGRLHRRGLQALALEAKLRRISLLELVSRTRLNMQASASPEACRGVGDQKLKCFCSFPAEDSSPLAAGSFNPQESSHAEAA